MDKIYYNNYPVCEIFNSENDLNFNNSDYIRNRFVEGNWYDAFIRVMEEFKEEEIKREEYYHRKYGRH